MPKSDNKCVAVFLEASPWLPLPRPSGANCRQFTSPAEEPKNTLYIATDESTKKYQFSRNTTGLLTSTLNHWREHNANVLERELLASRYRLKVFNWTTSIGSNPFADDSAKITGRRSPMKSWVLGPLQGCFGQLGFLPSTRRPSPRDLDGSYASGSCSNGPWIAHDFRFHRWS